MSKEKSPQTDRYEDFWNEWREIFLQADYPEDYINEEISRMRQNAKNLDVWPEGEDYAINMYKLRFVDIIDENL